MTGACGLSLGGPVLCRLWRFDERRRGSTGGEGAGCESRVHLVKAGAENPKIGSDAKIYSFSVLLFSGRSRRHYRFRPRLNRLRPGPTQYICT
jgi:hypothetical protein